MALAAVTLDDKYVLDKGRIFLSGIQALVRLPMMQRRRDAADGLDTAGFISGYRGSPLGGLDQNLWKARELLEQHRVRFQPGLNEDLAATAIWGTQQVNLFPGARHQGVFAMWYGKGPGVDRTGDVLKHGNAAGSSRYGGVLVIAGDDHSCKSSTLPHQSEYAFIDASTPVLNPSGVQDILDLGLHGFALSRYSGCWVGFKAIAETGDCSASVHVDPARIAINLPEDFALPPGGLNIRYPDPSLEQERRLHLWKLKAAQAYARANGLDRLLLDGPRPRLGVLVTGKSHLDTLQALEDLGVDDSFAAAIGLRVYKVALTWPLEPEGLQRFARGLEEILVVEEKRPVVEQQVKDLLYDLPSGLRPRILGKADERGAPLLPSTGELTPALIARALGARIARFHPSPRITDRLAYIAARERQLAAQRAPIERIPYFCSGCPHNTSTRVPEGSRAMAGIGCHYMATWMDRSTTTVTQMGGEGVPWIGQAPFTETKHIFANLGDGTYYHSGILAIRAAIAAGVNITYKLLFNDAVAMTGGQPFDGPLTVPQITRQLAAEGVGRIVVVTDEPDKYPAQSGFAPDVPVFHRRELDRVQRELREHPGVSVLVYDQTCAAEKRRRRKRGRYPDPPKRVFINDRVCEGCGDCSAKSNCVSVVPLETEFGRKRAIDQSSCNKDYSCVEGFCPSFVTVHGGALRKERGVGDDRAALPEPPPAPPLQAPYNVLVTGVGGTGVVTIGALLGMAAHLEGKGSSVVDITGMAQKGGAVISHIRIAARPEDIHATRIDLGGAHLLLGCDLVVSAMPDGLARLSEGASHAVVNRHETPTGDFTRHPDLPFPGAALVERIAAAVGRGNAEFIDATALAAALLGDAIASNLFLLGYAWQRGWIPLSAAAIERAIELNGVAVAFNQQAFRWGRRAAHDRAAVEAAAAPQSVAEPPRSRNLGEAIARRYDELMRYQDKAYADRYLAVVERVQRVERAKAPGTTALAEAVARNLYRLMAYKDEYEVARLYTDGAFLAKLRRQFEGDVTLEFHLAPPLLAARDPATGELKKRAYGPWMLRAFGLLARLKFLRGTPFDPFGRTKERRIERRLVAEYEALLDELLAGLERDNHALAVELASLPSQIRGFGHVKERNLAAARTRQEKLLEAFRTPPAPHAIAAE